MHPLNVNSIDDLAIQARLPQLTGLKIRVLKQYRRTGDYYAEQLGNKLAEHRIVLAL